MISKVLVATDGSVAALNGVKYAVYLASNLGCKITLLHVIEFPLAPYALAGVTQEERSKFQDAVRESGRSILRLSQGPLAEAGIAVNMDLGEGRPGDVICKYAQEGEFDLIIVGSKGRGRVSRVLLGSVSEEVVRAASVPVLVVRS